MNRSEITSGWERKNLTQEVIDALFESKEARCARIRYLQRLLAQSNGDSRAAERQELAQLLREQNEE